MAKTTNPARESAPEEHAEDLASLFAEVNDLPADDPLRSPELSAPSAQQSTPGAETASAGPPGPASVPATPPMKTETAGMPALPPSTSSPKGRTGSVAVPNQRVAVPSFAGKSVREVVVQASGLGLGVQIVGSGIARDQAPAAGTMVPAGTEIVVRFAQ